MSLGSVDTTTTTDTTDTTVTLATGAISKLSNTSSGIKIQWNQVSGAAGYYIYRKTGSASYKKIKTIISGSTVSYADTAVKKKNGTTYTYKVVPSGLFHYKHKRMSGFVDKKQSHKTKKRKSKKENAEKYKIKTPKNTK